MKYLPHSKINQ